MSYSKIVSDLFKDTGRVDVFVGAGVSYNSGLPLAIPLLHECLSGLGIEEEDLGQLIIPEKILTLAFESYIEIFLHNAESLNLLNVFKSGSMNSNHILIAKLFKLGLVRTIFTTNFDQHLEEALGDMEYEKYIREDDFDKIHSQNESKQSLVKLHGCISDPMSLRTTIETITSKSLSSNRDEAIQKAFQGSSQDKLLVLGYSFSDIFDVLPAIEKIFNPQKQLFVIEHTPGLNEGRLAQLESFGIGDTPQALRKFDGSRIKVNTDTFMDDICSTIDILNPLLRYDPVWQPEVSAWIDSLVPTYKKNSILAQVFYKVEDYRVAKKYYKKIVDSEEFAREESSGQNVRTVAATRTNLGLVYEHLDDLPNSIHEHNMALKLFQKVDYFFGVGACHNNIANALIADGNAAKGQQAHSHLLKAIKITKEKVIEGKTRLLADIYNTYGWMFEKRGDYQYAFDKYELALELDGEGNRLGESITLLNMARMKFKLGRTPEAMGLLEKSISIAKSFSHSSIMERCDKLKEEIDHC